jgi:hypothetical protein
MQCARGCADAQRECVLLRANVYSKIACVNAAHARSFKRRERERERERVFHMSTTTHTKREREYRAREHTREVCARARALRIYIRNECFHGALYTGIRTEGPTYTTARIKIRGECGCFDCQWRAFTFEERERAVSIAINASIDKRVFQSKSVCVFQSKRECPNGARPPHAQKGSINAYQGSIWRESARECVCTMIGGKNGSTNLMQANRQHPTSP